MLLLLLLLLVLFLSLGAAGSEAAIVVGRAAGDGEDEVCGRVVMVLPSTGSLVDFSTVFGGRLLEVFNMGDAAPSSF